MARHPRTHRRRPRNRSGGRLARLAYAKGPRWRAEAMRLRSDRPGLPSQLREPDWRPDIWESVPEPGENRRAYDAWRGFNARRFAAGLFLCGNEQPSKRELRRLKKRLFEPA